jgi:hypothetical protein
MKFSYLFSKKIIINFSYKKIRVLIKLYRNKILKKIIQKTHNINPNYKQ